MNRISLILLFVAIIATSSFSQKGPELTFEKTEIDLGVVKKGEKREGSFQFVNTGSEAIVIDIVSACECTTLEWTTDEVKPGGIGSVDFIFDSSQKEASETIDVDINLKNTDPKTGGPKLIIVSYKYELQL